MQTQIVHLVYNCPNMKGSVNSLVKAQLENLSQFSQLAVVGSDKKNCKCGNELSPYVYHVQKTDLLYFEWLLKKFPYKLRRIFYNSPIQSPEHLMFYLGSVRKIKSLKPLILVVYDDYKMLYNLKRLITWPCRIVFSQHGFSYHLCPQEASKVYSLQTLDLVHVLTYSSYQFDRLSISSYDPEVVVLPNGVDEKRFIPVSSQEKIFLRKKWGLPEDKFIFLILSRIVSKKGIHIILQIWKNFLQRYPNAFLWIVGDGESGYEEKLKSMIEDLGINNLMFRKGVEHTVVQECYQASDAYIFPALNTEGHGLTVLEAMSCGLPCVISNYPSALELFSDEEVLFNNTPNIPESYFPLMERIIQDGEFVQSMRFNARNAILKRFSLEKWLSKWVEIYDQQIRLLGVKR